MDRKMRLGNNPARAKANWVDLASPNPRAARGQAACSAPWKEHERKLKGVRQEVRNLQLMQMHPGRSAEELRHLADLERSARAEAKPRLRTLAYARSQHGEVSQASPAMTYVPRTGTYLMTP
jgi:hypothetical protein